MGEPKQLLRYAGKTLIEHIIAAAARSVCSPIVIVLGAHADRIEQEIEIPSSVQVVFNKDWQEGLSSSLRSGVQAVRRIDGDSEGIVTVLCDQPFVTSEVIDNIVQQFHTSGKLIVASQYSDVFGPPALFHSCLFDELLQISGDKGARSVVDRHSSEATSVQFPNGAVDVDTLDDYLALCPEAQARS